MPSRPRAPIGQTAQATALILSSGTGSLAADDPAMPGSPCEFVDVSELRSLSGLDFEPALSVPSVCNLVSPADESFHSIQLAIRPGVLDDQRQGDGVDLTFAGLPGLATVIDGNAEVYLDLGDGRLLRVGVTAGAVGDAGLGPLDPGRSIAESAAAGLLGTPADGRVGTAVDEVSLAPPAVEGLDMSFIRFDGDGPTLESEQPGMATALAPLLEALGADSGSMTVYQADSGGPNDAPGYQAFIALRIAGAGGGELGPAFLTALGLADRPDIEIGEAEVSGRSVFVLDSADLAEAVAYVYDAGDTVYLLQMDEELAARLLEALPSEALS